MTVDDYLIDPDRQDWPKLLADWRPLLPLEFSVWLMNRFGDLFLVAGDESVRWLDIAAGTLTRVADDWQDYSKKIDEGDNAEAWLRPSLVDHLVASGLVLAPGRCYGLRVAPVLGGTYEDGNIVVRPIAAQFAQFAPGRKPSHEVIVDDLPMTIRVDRHPAASSILKAPGKKPAAIKVDYRLGS